MGIIGAFILFLLFIFIYIAIVEIFTVLYRLTGMTEDKSRFQVISMLTNSGFTTNESELVVYTKTRRKLARATMLFGYSFTVTIVSLTLNMLSALSRTEAENLWGKMLVTVTAFAVFYLVLSVTNSKKHFDNIIEKIGNKLLFGKNANGIVILDKYGHNCVTEVRLTTLPEMFRSTPLISSGLREKYGVLVMVVKRENQYITQIDGELILQKDDLIIVFGIEKMIREVFEVYH